jgi:GxxExxY protein
MLRTILQCASDVFGELGGGHSEKTYHNALEIALQENALPYTRETLLPITYKNKWVGHYRVDLIVKGAESQELIIELKTCKTYPTQSMVTAWTDQADRYVTCLRGRYQAENVDCQVSGLVLVFTPSMVLHYSSTAIPSNLLISPLTPPLTPPITPTRSLPSTPKIRSVIPRVIHIPE